MKRLLFIILATLSLHQAFAQDTIWVKYDNRFKANKSFSIGTADSIEFRMQERDGSIPIMKIYRSNVSRGYVEYRLSTLFGPDGIYGGSIMLKNPGRILYQPSTYSNVNYSDNASRWSFKRSMESEHFVVFWEKGFGDDPTRAGSYSFNPKSMLANAEKIWNKYVDELGFLVPGKSTTDSYKIEMYVFYQTDWKAEGSGVDAKVGLLNVSPGAISSRGGMTVAHEIGHT
ncbi:MAG: hypothetical protein IIU48_06680, partial [Prevotella sp.]|nr:hypothetical protein [Prevotella sp.]